MPTATMLTIKGATISAAAQSKIEALFSAPELQALGTRKLPLLDPIDKLDEPDGLAHTEAYARAASLLAKFIALTRAAAPTLSGEAQLRTFFNPATEITPEACRQTVEAFYGPGWGSGDLLVDAVRLLLRGDRMSELTEIAAAMLCDWTQGGTDDLLDVVLAAVVVVSAEATANRVVPPYSLRGVALWAERVVTLARQGETRLSEDAVNFLEAKAAEIRANFEAYDAEHEAERAIERELRNAAHAAKLPWNLPRA